MINKLLKLSYVILAVGLVFVQYASALPADDGLTPLSRSEYFVPAPLVPQLSSDGKTLYNAVPPVVYVADPNPSHEPLRIPAPFDLLTLPPESATASFSITYVPNGGEDLWHAVCTTFPDEAKTVFEAAATIWANIIVSSVPITIKACWASLTGLTLGYSGGGPLHSSDFPGDIPGALPNTFYTGALANALSGYDRAPISFDMHITYNLNFSWYYGTDGLPGGQVDLMTVALHEIAHGLGFSGTMVYSGGTGSWGYYGLPTIYDTFMRDGSGNPGNQLINTGVYPNPSAALGSALTSNNIYFHGSNAMAANGGQRVRIYAPTIWAGGSSYSHLDYDTFNNTVNQLMVWQFSPGESVHDPGPITIGLLHDLGWPTCTYSIDPENSLPFNTSGGSGSFNIITQPGCAWTASEILDWAAITLGTGGSGSGTVNYTVSSNPETERSGIITISGQAFTGTHTITQEGCTYGNIYVKWDGYCAGKFPCYSWIQDAVDGADTCTIINATGDTYDEDVVLDDSKCLVLQGGWDSMLTTIQSNTTIRSLNIINGKLTVGNFILN